MKKFTADELLKIRKNLPVGTFTRCLVDLGFEEIGHGCYKVVFHKKGYNFVVKIGDYTHIRQEYINSISGPRRYLAKSYGIFKDTLIQQLIPGPHCTNWHCVPPKSLEFLANDWKTTNHKHRGKSQRPVVFDMGWGKL